jgi:hypothetical protein
MATGSKIKVKKANKEIEREDKNIKEIFGRKEAKGDKILI